MLKQVHDSIKHVESLVLGYKFLNLKSVRSTDILNTLENDEGLSICISFKPNLYHHCHIVVEIIYHSPDMLDVGMPDDYKYISFEPQNVNIDSIVEKGLKQCSYIKAKFRDHRIEEILKQ